MTAPLFTVRSSAPPATSRGRWSRRVAGLLASLFLLGSIMAVVNPKAFADQGTGGQPANCMVVPTFLGQNPTLDTSSSMFSTHIADNNTVDTTKAQTWAPLAAAPNSNATVYESVGMAGTSWTWSKIGQQQDTSNSKSAGIVQKVVGNFGGPLIGKVTGKVAGMITKQVTQGLSGSKFSRGSGASEDDEYDCNIYDAPLTYGADAMFSWSKNVTAFAISFRHLTSTPTVFVNMLDGATGTVSKFFDVAAAGIGTIGIMLTMLYIAGHSLGREETRRRAIRAGGSLFICVFTGIVLMVPTNHTVTDTVNGTTVSGTKPNYFWLTNGLFNREQQGQGVIADFVLPSPDSTSVCTLDSSAPNRSLRLLDCSIYESMIYQPWVQGEYGQVGSYTVPSDKITAWHDAQTAWIAQLGSNASKAQLPMMQLRAQALTGYDAANPNATDALAVGASNSGYVTIVKDTKVPADSQSQWNVIREMVYEKYPNAWQSWRGSDPVSRLTLAGFSLVVALLQAAFQIFSGVHVLLWLGALVLLYYLLPAAFTIGSIPSMADSFFKWFNLTFKVYGMLLMFGFVQLVSLSLMAGILRSSLGLGLKGMMCLALLLGLVRVLKMIQSQNLIQVGGAKAAAPSMQTVDMATKATKAGGGMAARVALATAAGVATGGSSALAGGLMQRRKDRSQGRTQQSAAHDSEIDRRLRDENEKRIANGDAAYTTKEMNARRRAMRSELRGEDRRIARSERPSGVRRITKGAAGAAGTATGVAAGAMRGAHAANATGSEGVTGRIKAAASVGVERGRATAAPKERPLRGKDRNAALAAEASRMREQQAQDAELRRLAAEAREDVRSYDHTQRRNFTTDELAGSYGEWKRNVSTSDHVIKSAKDRLGDLKEHGIDTPSPAVNRRRAQEAETLRRAQVLEAQRREAAKEAAAERKRVMEEAKRRAEQQRKQEERRKRR